MDGEEIINEACAYDFLFSNAANVKAFNPKKYGKAALETYAFEKNDNFYHSIGDLIKADKAIKRIENEFGNENGKVINKKDLWKHTFHEVAVPDDFDIKYGNFYLEWNVDSESSIFERKKITQINRKSGFTPSIHGTFSYLLNEFLRPGKTDYHFINYLGVYVAHHPDTSDKEIRDYESLTLQHELRHHANKFIVDEPYFNEISSYICEGLTGKEFLKYDVAHYKKNTLIERKNRYKKFLKINAPEPVLNNESELIETAKQHITNMKSFPFEKIMKLNTLGMNRGPLSYLVSLSTPENIGNRTDMAIIEIKKNPIRYHKKENLLELEE